MPISDEISKCNAQYSDDLKTAVDHQKTAYSALKIHWKWMKTRFHQKGTNILLMEVLERYKRPFMTSEKCSFQAIFSLYLVF